MRGKEKDKRIYKLHDTCTVERFIWFPLNLATKRQPENKSFRRTQWRWLEKAWIVIRLECGGFTEPPFWTKVRWGD